MRRSLIIVSILLALAAHAVAQTPDEALKAIQANIQKRQYEQAVADVEAHLKNAELTPDQRIRFLRLAADATGRMGQDRIPDAIAFHERIVEDATLPIGARIEALRAIADLQVEALKGKSLAEMDLSAAYATLERALSLPGLTPRDEVAALKNIGRLYEREDRFAEARATYERILALDVSDSAKNEAHRLIADTLLGEGQVEQGLAIYREKGLDLIEAYRRLGDAEGRRAECMKILADEAVSEAARWAAFTKLPCWEGRRDLKGIREASEAYLPQFMQADPNRALVLRPAVLNASVDADAAFIEWAAPVLLQAPKLSDQDYAAVRGRLVDALAAQGKRAEAIRAADEMAGDERVAPPLRLAARVTAAALRGQEDISTVVNSDEAVNAAQRADAMLTAARTALRAGDDAVARRLYEAWQALVPQEPRGSVLCVFDAKAPFDIGSWLGSPIRQDKARIALLDKPYGDNIEFLLQTDSAVTGRNAGQDAQAAGDQRTELLAACDAEGIHLFLYAYDDRAADIVNGRVSGGSFEIYFAPGDYQAYYTFLVDLPGGRPNPRGFITMYPNANFRLPAVEDGTFRSQSRPTDDGFATHMFLSWELFYDKLPRNGDRWQFEAIRWTRSGGLTFGGSESVHNRSSWGEIVFDGLDDAQLNAIRRRIIPRAIARYRAARSVVGAAGHWEDPELGDPAFYQDRLKPMLDRLDADAKLAQGEMTDEQVEEIFQRSVRGWMEIGYLVSAMRAEYLRDKHLGIAR